MNIARELARRTDFDEQQVRVLLKELRTVIIESANRGEQVSIPTIGKFVVRRRRRYLGAKRPSKVTGKAFGARMRLGLFFNSFKSLDKDLESRLGWIEKRQGPRTEIVDPDWQLKLFMAANRSF